jgi:hypothetical protein
MPSLEIPPPDPLKPPLKSNVFQMLRMANTALAPMFPYAGDGDMVPAATVFWGGPNRETSVFTHTNSVDEVAICFASEKSRMRAGFVHVGARTHLVGGFFEDCADPDILMVIVVTQRQAEREQPQSEALTFMCESCQAPLLHHEFSSKGARPEDADGGFHPWLETLTEGALCLEPFNADPALRVCKSCGHQNPPWPVSVWGWDAYQKNTDAAERARAQVAVISQQFQD